MNNQYLLEIGVEELPARFVEMGLGQLKDQIKKRLDEQAVDYDEIESLATPRRLTIIIKGLADKQKNMEEIVKGPSVKISYDENHQPTKPLLGFMKSKGLTEEDLYQENLKGTDYIYAKIQTGGKDAESILQEIIPESIRGVSFPKNMRWGGKNIRFARPIRWIVSLFNDRVIAFDFEGIPVGQESRSHRFLGKNPLLIPNVDSYEDLLLENYVLVDQKKRYEKIKYQATRKAKALGGEIKEDEDLFQELTYIVEYPTAIVGNVNEKYMSLPPVVITTPMREHLRYIPVYDTEGALKPYFITIRNGNSDYEEIVAQGNEKVLAARLEDAVFFYEEDQKRKLEDRLEDLKGVMFHDKLGTLYDKTGRLQALTEQIGDYLQVAEETKIALGKASNLAKTDLVTNMVQEFTELQGLMGAIYAKNEGRPDIIATALNEQYMPRKANGDLPLTTTGSILSIADKLDTIVGLFAIDLIPTGSQDPFGLRRQAIGLINIIKNKNWHLPLSIVVDYALYIYVGRQELVFDYNIVKEAIMNFLLGRIRQMLLDEGYRYDLIDAVLATGLDDVVDIFKRCQDLKVALEDLPKDFFEAYIRLGHLAVKYQDSMEFSQDQLLEDQEKKLYEEFTRVKAKIDEEIEPSDYLAKMQSLNELTDTIHDYFDQVMVLTEDPILSSNRLSMLHNIYEEVKGILDINQLVLE